MFFKIRPTPLAGSLSNDSYYNINRLVAYFRKNKIQVRGKAH